MYFYDIGEYLNACRYTLNLNVNEAFMSTLYDDVINNSIKNTKLNKK